ncbi:MAG: hypothetical protein ABFS56_30795 [Pseudomonadota bacterium]
MALILAAQFAKPSEERILLNNIYGVDIDSQAVEVLTGLNEAFVMRRRERG